MLKKTINKNSIYKDFIISEEFKPIKGYERYLTNGYNMVYDTKFNKIINEYYFRSGYHYYRLNGHTVYTHRINYMYHYNEIPLTYTIDHKDFNKSNNHISNLQLLTKRDNILKTRKEFRKPNVYLDKEKQVELYNDLEKGFTYEMIQDKYNISYLTTYNYKKKYLKSLEYDI